MTCSTVDFTSNYLFSTVQNGIVVQILNFVRERSSNVFYGLLKIVTTRLNEIIVKKLKNNRVFTIHRLPTITKPLFPLYSLELKQFFSFYRTYKINVLKGFRLIQNWFTRKKKKINKKMEIGCKVIVTSLLFIYRGGFFLSFFFFFASTRDWIYVKSHFIINIFLCKDLMLTRKKKINTKMLNLFMTSNFRTRLSDIRNYIYSPNTVCAERIRF